MLKLGSQPVQFTLGARYYAEKPEGGPDWGLRFVVPPHHALAMQPANERAY